ncbi:hypothetical protein P4S93_12845 [Aneurinibacillus thermoaerophilus]|uniref:Cysteine-rich CPCC n=1 Tax=Aneurinibacillus thermoaerophilus TaxID=143495 RepID=A0ABX8Y9V8_ANETH|nr:MULTISPECIES: hypothetical protein [Aneurinibacillus]MED0675508.1 hypothetical protein [Aneurinibacillus thermoaerophilus]MED0680275.1 hypothetical protein [Aneurinibacillus thermoaerophilus]MED0758720.1 hypothetical protein [Aneurinibacillus thermoaerophilus]MED0761652.1 hypothetical protein [Aneurinibacillus thermoaerophilus]MED0765886.1 hypothetical protein [Aneurinibacillus thermoaerophilus]
MEFFCPPCRKVIDDSHPLCDQAQAWFYEASGKRLWRIRRLNEYAYQYVTDEEYSRLCAERPIILSEARSWEDFDCSSYTGIDSRGERTSIFD